jgi:serine/threonine-protein kinase
LYTLAWVDRNGREEAIPAPARAYQSVRLSPDGSALALDAWDQERDVWIWHLARRTLTRLTFDRGTDRSPLWTPDGRRIVFSSDRDRSTPRVYWQAADGTGPAERLTDGEAFQVASSVTPDGLFALIADQRDGPADINAVPLRETPADPKPATAREARTLVKTPFVERNGVVSPDGRWLAYESNTSGDFEIYVRPYPDTTAGQWQVSAGGGTRPVWSRDSRWLFFVADGAITEVSVNAGSTWSSSVPQPAIKGAYALDATLRISLPTVSSAVNLIHPFDVSPDGKRFVLLKDEARQSKSTAPAIVVVKNWGEELKRLVK